MINSKTEYYEYLEADRQANKKKKIHAHLFGDYTYNPDYSWNQKNIIAALH